MQRHPTLDGRQSESRLRHSQLVTRHSSLVTVSSALCIALFAAVTANADMALHFDGNTYINLNKKFPLGDSVSLSAWARIDSSITNNPPNGNKNYGAGIAGQGYWGGTTGFGLFVSGGLTTANDTSDDKVSAQVRYGDNPLLGLNYFDPTLFTNGEWHHYLVVRDKEGGMAYLYVDGALADSGAFPSGTSIYATSGKTPTVNFAIGKNMTNVGGSFRGYIADVGLWDVALTADDAAKLTLVPPDRIGKPPYAYWPLDEGTGTAVADMVSGVNYPKTAGTLQWGDDPTLLRARTAIAASVAQTNGVWYATASLDKGSGPVDLLVVSPQGATNVIALSDGNATAPATFTTAIPGLDANAAYSVAARVTDGGIAIDSDSAFFLNGAVSVAATADATSATPGAFTVSRASTADATALPLTVNFTLSGTAVSGKHYAPIPATVTIPAGAASAMVQVTALQKETAETSLTLALSDGNYIVGDPSSATMSIATVFARKIVRVAPGGTGDGSSWANAMGSVANAYASAAAFVENEVGAAEVWIKTGRYTITSTIALKSGVSVLGGFLGTETDALQARRDNLTIISGDKNDDDYWMPCGTNTAEKLYVWTGEDKMTFNPPAPRDPDEYWQLSNGGANNYNYGFQALAANPPVTNCTFAGLTFTSFRYCPLYMLDGGPHVGVAVTNCNFWACSDDGYGGVVVSAAKVGVSDNLCWGGRARIRIATPASVSCTNEIVNCVFRDSSDNGGLYFAFGTTNNTWRVKNCGFFRNRCTANNYSPVVHLSSNVSGLRLEMTDCYVRECILTGSCMGFVGVAAGGGSSHTLLFKDCDFQGNVRSNCTGTVSGCFTGGAQGKNWFFDGCSFRGNRTWYHGTGIAASVYSSTAANQYTTFLNCSIESNSVQVINGAAAKVVGTVGMSTAHTRISLINCLLDGNAFGGAATNAEVFSATSGNQLLAIVNSVLKGDGDGYVPLRTAYSTGGLRLKPYLYRSMMSNFDKDAVGTYDYGRREGISTNVDPVVCATLRAKAGRPHRIRGLWVDSPFWRGGTDIWIRPRPTTYPQVYLHNSSGKTPWYPINNGSGESSQDDATMETWGITVDSPLCPDALGNRRKKGKVAYGPIGYAHPAVMAVR